MEIENLNRTHLSLKEKLKIVNHNSEFDLRIWPENMDEVFFLKHNIHYPLSKRS